MATYYNGYSDENFQHPVGKTFHCVICTNVFKDPVMCPQNQHLFCRSCITRHLMNFRTCPSCMQPLAVETLSEAPRAIKNLLSELKIRCEFFNRGCQQFVELGDLERHVEECRFAPAVSSNEGCQLEVNKRDLIHHETAVCERRRMECHRCNEIKQEMNAVKLQLAEMKNEMTVEMKVEMNKNFVNNAKIIKQNTKTLQEQLHDQQVGLEKEIEELKESLAQITKQLQQLTENSEMKIVVAGGYNEDGVSNSVEMFSSAKRMWKRLRPMKERRDGASSVVYNNQMMVMGGDTGSGCTDTMETLTISADQDNPLIQWKISPLKLPSKLFGYSCVAYNEQLIVIGGSDEGKNEYSDSITEVSIVPPYTSKLLAKMPERRLWHGVGLFDDKIVIVGGKQTWSTRTNLSSVLMHDITKNKCKELAPLPYPVSKMATVIWGDNIIIMGGVDTNYKPLNKVVIYNVKTQKSHMLPEMKCKRAGCVAVVVKDTVIVMGGQNEKGNYLKSVESFRFDRYTWEELPEMNEARLWAAAVVLKINKLYSKD